MSEKNTIARPYAKALFEVAKAQDRLAHWFEVLSLTASITKNSGVISLLKHPRFSSQDSVDFIMGLLFDIAGIDLNAPENEKIKIALVFIAQSKRLLFLPEIAHLFEQLKRESEKIVDVTIISAIPLDSGDNEVFVKKITQALKRRLKNDVALHFETDETIIGGAIIKAGDVVIDGSLGGRLVRLRDALGV